MVIVLEMSVGRSVGLSVCIIGLSECLFVYLVCLRTANIFTFHQLDEKVTTNKYAISFR